MYYFLKLQLYKQIKFLFPLKIIQHKTMTETALCLLQECTNIC